MHEKPNRLDSNSWLKTVHKFVWRLQQAKLILLVQQMWYYRMINCTVHFEERFNCLWQSAKAPIELAAVQGLG